MVSPAQLLKGVKYYAQALGVFLQLQRYLKRHFLSDLNFPDSLVRDYYYGSPYYNRTKQYMHANHFFGELLCVLRGKKMTKAERMRFANLSAVAPIFDDFFDKQASDLQKVKDLLNAPQTELAETEEQKLAVLFLQNCLDTISDKNAFLAAANKLFDAQVDALEKQSKQTEPAQLWQFSEKKGGYSGVMYAHLLEGSLSPDMEGLAYDLGAFGQFMDDVFDLYDDRKAGVYTFPNTAKNVKEVDDFFHAMLKAIIDKVNHLEFPKKSKQDFYNILQIFATSIRMALQQYQKIESEKRVPPSQCIQLERSLWIVDMERPINVFKMFKHSLSYLR